MKTIPSGGPLCAACRKPMDAALAELERWVTHPCCPGPARAALSVVTPRRAA